MKPFTNANVASTSTTYYDVLGIAPPATSDDIRVAFRRLAKIYHPDKNMGKKDAEKAVTDAKYAEVYEAYTVLSDPAKRTQYDQQYSIGSPSTSPLVAMVSPARLI